MGYIKRRYTVLVGGVDVTSRLAPRLLKLSVKRCAGKATDSADIELANPNGSVFMPQERAPIDILLDGVWVFTGFVAEVSCSIDKDGGRKMKINASSVDHGGKAKTPSLRHKDKANLAAVAQEFGGKAGLQVTVMGEAAQIERDYWLQQNESFVSWGQRIARETGCTFKVIGDRAFIAPRNEGFSASGKPLTTIPAAWGANLLSADVTPIVSRPKYKNVKVSYYDTAKARRVEVDVASGVTDVDSILRTVLSAANEDHAKQKAKSLGKESAREQGQGNAKIVGDPRAEPEALCELSGVAPGADGTYRIDAVTHEVDSKGGFETTLDLRQPQGSAGKDKRKPKGSKTDPLTKTDNSALNTTGPAPTIAVA